MDKPAILVDYHLSMGSKQSKGRYEVGSVVESVILEVLSARFEVSEGVDLVYAIVLYATASSKPYKLVC